MKLLSSNISQPFDLKLRDDIFFINLELAYVCLHDKLWDSWVDLWDECVCVCYMSLLYDLN